MFPVIMSQFWSNIFVVSSKNVSRLRRLPIMMEYFIDQEKYFDLILLHINVTIFIGCVAVLAVGTILVTFLQHICGMFRIAWYEYKCRNDHNNLNCN